MASKAVKTNARHLQRTLFYDMHGVNSETKELPTKGSLISSSWYVTPPPKGTFKLHLTFLEREGE